MNKYFIVITIFYISLINCSLSGSSEISPNMKPIEVSRCFAKAICTKDTNAFYSLVNKELLTASMNDWIKVGKKLGQEDIFFPFFFVYSPMKIRQEDLTKQRHKENFFKEFKVENEYKSDNSNIKLTIIWVQNLPSAEIQKIELRLKKFETWKIVGASWETL
jgi:hypothetical protein